MLPKQIMGQPLVLLILTWHGTLCYVMSLKVSLNLICVSELNGALNYSIPFLANHCLLHYLAKKQIVGTGHEFGSLSHSITKYIAIRL